MYSYGKLSSHSYWETAITTHFTKSTENWWIQVYLEPLFSYKSKDILHALKHSCPVFWLTWDALSEEQLSWACWCFGSCQAIIGCPELGQATQQAGGAAMMARGRGQNRAEAVLGHVQPVGYRLDMCHFKIK